MDVIILENHDPLKKKKHHRGNGIFKTGKYLIIMLNIIAALVLLMPLFIARDSIDSDLLPLSGLVFPYFLFLNMLFVFLWLSAGKKLFIISLVAMIATTGISGSFFQWNLFNYSNSNNGIKVLSFNVKYLGMDYEKKNIQYQNDLLQFLEKENPEIICLQEFDCLPGTFLKTVEEIKAKTGMKHYVFTRYYPGTENTERIILFSKEEVVKKGSLTDPHTRRYAVYADFVHQQDTLRIINAHLQSVYLKEEDQLGLADFKGGNASQAVIRNKGARMYEKLTKAFKKRAVQTDSLSLFISKSPYKVILCGDFNDTPASYSYQTISKQLTDGFKASGKGVGTSFNGKYPGLRIDYIFYDKNLRSLKYKTHRDIEFSDHFPVSTIITNNN